MGQTTQDAINRRAKDVSLEKQTRPFLEAAYQMNGFAPKYNTVENCGIRNPREAERHVIDLEKQGVDVYLTAPNGKQMVVDEKSAASQRDAYSSLRTYSFEVTTNNNVGKHGWLFKEGCMATHYALIYPDIVDKDINTLSKMEVLLVSRDKLLSALANEGIRDERSALKYFEKHAEMCDDGNERCHINDYMTMTKSNNIYPERPLNIIIQRSYLRDMLSEYDFEVKDVSRMMEQYAEQNKEKQVTGKQGLVLNGQSLRDLYKIEKQVFKHTLQLDMVTLEKHMNESLRRYPDEMMEKNFQLRIIGAGTDGKHDVLQVSVPAQLRELTGKQAIYINCSNQEPVDEEHVKVKKLTIQKQKKPVVLYAQLGYSFDDSKDVMKTNEEFDSQMRTVNRDWSKECIQINAEGELVVPMSVSDVPVHEAKDGTEPDRVQFREVEERDDFEER